MVTTELPKSFESARGPDATIPTMQEKGVLARMRRTVPTALVIATLGGLAFWGHRTEWTFKTGHHGPTINDLRHPSSGVAIVRFGTADGARGDLPPALHRGAAIIFDSAETVEKAGIDIAVAWTAAMTETILASGEIQFDPSRTARLSARAPGTAWQVTKVEGDPVKAGDVLALIDAAEVGKTKAEFQQALVQMRLKQQALADIGTAGNVVPEPQRQQAAAALRDADVRLLAAEQALINLGLPTKAADYQGLSIDEVVRRMRLLGVGDAVAAGPAGPPTTANLLPVRSPLDGVLVKADIVTGEVAEAGRVLFVVVDPRRLWLTVNVSVDDARRVALGQTVRFRPDGLGEEFTGAVNWIGTSADETTRTVPVRAELKNEDGRLRASTLGLGRIVLRDEPQAVVVPNEAIQWAQEAPVVFVRDPDFLKPNGPKAFRLRIVHLGARDETNTEIRASLKAGEVIAGKGATVLLNEWKRAVNESAGAR